MFRHFILFWGLLLTVGCATANPRAMRIAPVDRPLVEIQKLVVSQLPIGQRAVSPNAREFLSKHFVPKRDGYAEADTSGRRWFAHIFILGDRRPYAIEILVKRERRVVQQGVLTYKPDGLDLRIANNLKNKLVEELTKRREDGNLIDDFRVF